MKFAQWQIFMSRIRESILEGDFLLQDSISPSSFIKASKKNCHVNLGLDNENQVMLQYCNVKSGCDQTVTFNEGEWLVFFAETQTKTISMALARVDRLQDYNVVIEAKYEDKPKFCDIDQMLRKSLRVTSYDITIRYTDSEQLVSAEGVIHIFPNKVLVTQGFPPDVHLVLEHSLEAQAWNDMKLVEEDGLWFSTKPDLCIFSEHRETIWRTLQQCVTQLKHTNYDRFLPATCVKTVYQNLPRPCYYVYMNVNDEGNDTYVNIFKMKIYQNWNVQDSSGGDVPPPRPPKRPPPRLPPKPQNRPPNSPLPQIPKNGVVQSCKELQYVMYCSKPLVGHFWVIQVVFMQKSDDITLQRIKKLEAESSYQLLNPLPGHIHVNGDLHISIELSKGNACCLRSDSSQTIAYEVIEDVVLKSYWMIIEFHLEHMGTEGRSFHGKIMMRPKCGNSPLLTKDTRISASFKDDLPNGCIHDHQVARCCNSLKALGVKKYFHLCSLLDIHSVLGKDWMGLAGEVGLTVDQVFKIQSKALFPEFSPTNEVLNMWSQQKNSKCSVTELRLVLGRLGRFDVIQSVLDDND